MYSVDTNILVNIFKFIEPILKYDSRTKTYTQSKYEGVRKFAATPNGKEFYAKFRKDNLSADFGKLWNFIADHPNDFKELANKNSLSINDLLRFAKVPSDPNDKLVINSVTYLEYFDKVSFKASKPLSKSSAAKQKAKELNIAILEGAPGLTIENSDNIQLGFDAPSKVSNGEDPKRSVKKFFEDLAQDVNPNTEHRAELKKFYLNLIQAKIEQWVDVTDRLKNIVTKYKDFQAELSDSKLPNLESPTKNINFKPSKKLDGISHEEMINILFSEDRENFDIGDITYLLLSAKKGHIAWTGDFKMMYELFKYPIVMAGLIDANVKIEFRGIGIVDFSTVDSLYDSILTIEANKFDKVLEKYSKNLNKVLIMLDVEGVQHNNPLYINIKNLIEQELENLGKYFSLEKPEYTELPGMELIVDAAKSACAFIKATPNVVFSSDATVKSKCYDVYNYELQKRIEESSQITGDKDPNSMHLEYAPGKHLKSSAGFGSQVDLADALGMIQLIMQGRGNEIAKSIGLNLIPLFSHKITKAATEVLIQGLSNELLNSYKLSLNSAFKSSLSNAVKANAIKGVKLAPNIVAFLASTAITVGTGGFEGDKVVIAVNGAIISLEFSNLVKIFFTGSKIPGINVATAILSVAAMGYEAGKGVAELNNQISLSIEGKIQNFFSLLLEGKPAKGTDDLISIQEANIQMIADVYEFFKNNFGKIILPIPDIKITENKIITGTAAVGGCRVSSRKEFDLVPRAHNASITMNNDNVVEDQDATFFAKPRLKKPYQLTCAPINNKPKKIDEDPNTIPPDPLCPLGKSHSKVAITYTVENLNIDSRKTGRNECDGFVAIMKHGFNSQTDSTLVITTGKEGDKINLNQKGSYTVFLKGDSKVEDIEITNKDSDNRLIIDNEKDITVNENIADAYKGGVMALGNNVITTSVSTVPISIASGVINVNYTLPGVIHIPTKLGPHLTINYMQENSQAGQIYLARPLTDLSISYYDKDTKTLYLEFTTGQDIEITNLEGSNFPLLNFDDGFAIQLDAPGENGFITSFSAAFDTKDKKRIDIANKIKDIINNDEFSTQFSYVIVSAESEKFHLFASNKIHVVAISTVPEKENIVLISSATNAAIFVDNPKTDIYLYSDLAVNIYTAIPETYNIQDYGNAIIRYKTVDIDGIKSDTFYYIECRDLRGDSDNAISGTKIILSAVTSYKIGENGKFKLSGDINLIPGAVSYITLLQLEERNLIVSLQDISKKDVNFIRDQEDLVMIYPKSQSSLRIKGGLTLINDFINRANQEALRVEHLADWDLLGENLLKWIFGPYTDPRMLSFEFSDGKITEADLLEIHTFSKIVTSAIESVIKTINLKTEDNTEVYLDNMGPLIVNYDKDCAKTVVASWNYDPSDPGTKDSIEIKFDQSTDIDFYNTSKAVISPLINCNDFAFALPNEQPFKVTEKVNSDLIEHMQNLPQVSINKPLIDQLQDSTHNNFNFVVNDMKFIIQQYMKNGELKECYEFYEQSPATPSPYYPSTLSAPDASFALQLVLLEFTGDILLKEKTVAGAGSIVSGLQHCFPMQKWFYDESIRMLGAAKPLYEELAEMLKRDDATLRQKIQDVANQVSPDQQIMSDDPGAELSFTVKSSLNDLFHSAFSTSKAEAGHDNKNLDYEDYQNGQSPDIDALEPEERQIPGRFKHETLEVEVRDPVTSGSASGHKGMIQTIVSSALETCGILANKFASQFSDNIDNRDISSTETSQIKPQINLLNPEQNTSIGFLKNEGDKQNTGDSAGEDKMPDELGNPNVPYVDFMNLPIELTSDKIENLRNDNGETYITNVFSERDEKAVSVEDIKSGVQGDAKITGHLGVNQSYDLSNCKINNDESGSCSAVQATQTACVTTVFTDPSGNNYTLGQNCESKHKEYVSATITAAGKLKPLSADALPAKLPTLFETAQLIEYSFKLGRLYYSGPKDTTIKPSEKGIQGLENLLREIPMSLIESEQEAMNNFTAQIAAIRSLRKIDKEEWLDLCQLIKSWHRESHDNNHESEDKNTIVHNYGATDMLSNCTGAFFKVPSDIIEMCKTEYRNPYGFSGIFLQIQDRVNTLIGTIQENLNNYDG